MSDQKDIMKEIPEGDGYGTESSAPEDNYILPDGEPDSYEDDTADEPEENTADGGESGGDVTVQESEVKKTGKYDKLFDGETTRFHLTGMYKDWFLDYASYVILERAVPHIADGLKPVHRRILHAMKRLDDGRYNKVANVIGHTMQFHPHGDASIGDALVQLGQKDLLIDCQGNWGNILTGDEAAASRYIEARLSKFALDVVFNPKTTEWMLTYDGRNQEPVTLPVKFPLLLAQGVEGIAVGLASKILPHNFNELIDACIAHLRGQDFQLYPDFQTGGLADVSRYNDGLRGGAVKVRAKISKIDRKTLAITEIPYGTTTESIKESIIKANDRGKIRIRKVDDNTAEKVEILVHVSNDESSDKTIDALYAFTDCEVSISPNSCVIEDEKPHFLGVSEILRRSAEKTKQLLKRELEIRLDELNEDWHMANLERIFIENKIYQRIEGSKTREDAYAAVDEGLEPFKKLLRREVVQEDIVKLTELKFIRISRFDTSKAEEHIKSVEEEMAQVKHDLEYLTDYAVAYYKRIKQKYGKGRERRTELRGFDVIEAVNVVVANAKLYADREEGFFGIGRSMKDAEFVCDCSDMDDVIVITKEGRYIITKVCEKAFFAKNILYIGVFKRNDERTIYNILYRDGRNGPIMMKRCAITSITRDREYDMTKGTPKSEILYMSVNPNGEAEVLKVYFRPRPRLKKLIVDLDFSTLAIRSRGSQGNLFSRYGIQKIVLKEAGTSTLAGQNIWYDEEVRRLNTDGRGVLLGEFRGADRIIVMTAKGQYYTTGYDLGHHFPDDLLRIEKYDTQKIYSAAYYDAGSGFFYLKRFAAEQSEKMLNFVDEDHKDSRLAVLSDDYAPILEVIYKGKNKERPADMIDVEEFIGVKSHRAKGKRITTLEVGRLAFAEPRIKERPPHAVDTIDAMMPDDTDELSANGLDVAQLTETHEVTAHEAAENKPVGDKIPKPVPVLEREPVSEREADSEREPAPVARKPVGGRAKTVGDKVNPVVGAAKPAGDVEKPAGSTTEPVVSAAKPVGGEAKPDDVTTESVDDVEFVIERAKGDENGNPDSAQLDLF